MKCLNVDFSYAVFAPYTPHVYTRLNLCISCIIRLSECLLSDYVHKSNTYLITYDVYKYNTNTKPNHQFKIFECDRIPIQVTSYHSIWNSIRFVRRLMSPASFDLDSEHLVWQQICRNKTQIRLKIKHEPKKIRS